MRQHRQKERLQYPAEKLRNPLTMAAEYIYDRLCPDDKDMKLSQELTQLSCGEKNCVRAYYVRKISLMLFMVLMCAVILTAVLMAERRKDRTVAGGLLERPGYGEDGSDQSLGLTIAGEAESEAVDIHLDPRIYTKAEARRLLKMAEEELLRKIPGENASPDEIRGRIFIPSELQNRAVSAEYYITPSGMIDEDGLVIGEPEEEGSLIAITVTLTCQEEERTVECAARIYPPHLSEEEALRKKIRNAIEDAQTENPSDSKMQLPREVDGRKLHWTYQQDPAVRMLLVLLLILPAAFWVRGDSAVQDRAKARKAQLELDYSQLLWKLTMLLSAGLTIRGAFTRIAAQYEAEYRNRDLSADRKTLPGIRGVRKKQPTELRAFPETRRQPSADHGSPDRKRQIRYVYEEMLLALREMQSGVPEASSYENFGRRCGLPSYIKLGSILSQNLKKGSKGLTALLEHEAVLSLEQHKMAVRKMGEKAGIRMLLPMILMFGVVLIILMVPAFLSM